MQNNIVRTFSYDHNIMLSSEDICQGTSTGTLNSECMFSEATSDSWQIKASSKINELVMLPANWDSYGALQVDPRNAKYAYDLIGMLMIPNLPFPLIVPTNSGGIQLEWHAEGVDLEIKILSVNKINVYFDLEPYPEWEGIITYDLESLDLFTNELVEH